MKRLMRMATTLGALLLITGGLAETGNDGGCGGPQCQSDCKGAKDEAACVKACEENEHRPGSVEM